MFLKPVVSSSVVYGMCSALLLIRPQTYMGYIYIEGY